MSLVQEYLSVSLKSPALFVRTLSFAIAFAFEPNFRKPCPCTPVTPLSEDVAMKLIAKYEAEQKELSAEVTEFEKTLSTIRQDEET